MQPRIKKLNRFTSLPVLIDLLEREKIVLIEPSSWDDKNDTLIIKEYKKKAGFSKLFALCFTPENETIHHWKTFADGISGCCIQFNGIKIIKLFAKTEKIRHGFVKYRKINEVENSDINFKDIPFIKREPYQFENEYRVIWEGNDDLSVFEMAISLEIIDKITFAYQMPEPVFQSVKKMIETRYPKLQGKVNKSTIYENYEWIEKFEKIESTKAQQCI
ncbi:hypothetical protein KMW28_06055 [Flammeovirga yaeyamensis]|uniref:DUF2971 domain-containing protein n=1 Tax=Flammeovirga yaeyamensis TaxID=367791 RepID=A0AAX1N7C7_9BACT|nr:hypothetical protein [Flammeovirga yaeyamensis]MBB3697733.1 hypothetical protein [Flammeovirga yaeyamensis]NMF35909.1 hypothetical protein [Flammeovirga yaeyamensis]QWG03141.1 hypothetical protein KMW28_06055 [Flammeovirga yaeyamensis]